jgi:hypothetical protein
LAMEHLRALCTSAFAKVACVYVGIIRLTV